VHSLPSARQAFRTERANVRVVSSSGTCAMGFGLPGIIGAAVTKALSTLVPVVGDTGFHAAARSVNLYVHVICNTCINLYWWLRMSPTVGHLSKAPRWSASLDCLPRAPSSTVEYGATYRMRLLYIAQAVSMNRTAARRGGR
jgi:hypothetical protein